MTTSVSWAAMIGNSWKPIMPWRVPNFAAQGSDTSPLRSWPAPLVRDILHGSGFHDGMQYGHEYDKSLGAHVYATVQRLIELRYAAANLEALIYWAEEGCKTFNNNYIDYCGRNDRSTQRFAERASGISNVTRIRTSLNRLQEGVQRELERIDEENSKARVRKALEKAFLHTPRKTPVTSPELMELTGLSSSAVSAAMGAMLEDVYQIRTSAATK
jgi:hypothetical protein